MTSFTNRVVLITGAGSGIGRQLALSLAGEGAAIAGVDLRAEPLEALAAELAGKKVAWATADVTSRQALGPAVAQLQEKLGPVDIMIASAGIAMETAALDFRAEDIEAEVRVNLIGVANTIGAVLPGMLARKQGHLVAISSLASFRGIPKLAGYSASKAGVNALLDSLRVELAGHGIAVTTLCPGFIRTPMTTQLEGTGVQLMELDEATRLMVEAIRKRKPFYAFPRSAARWVGLSRLLPIRWSDWLLARFQQKLEQQQK